MTIEMYQLVNLSGEADGPLYKSIDEAREDADGTQAIDMITFEYSDRELVETPDGENTWPPEYRFQVAPLSDDASGSDGPFVAVDGLSQEHADHAADAHPYGGIIKRSNDRGSEEYAVYPFDQWFETETEAVGPGGTS